MIPILITLQYLTDAKAIKSGEDFFSYARADVHGEFIAVTNLVLSDPIPISVFSGVFDGQDKLINVESQPFERLQDCTIKYATIVCDGAPFAESAYNIKLVSLRLINLQLGQMEHSEIIQTWIQEDNAIFATYENCYFGGSVINSSIANTGAIMHSVMFVACMLNYTEEPVEYITNSEFRGSKIQRISLGEYEPIGLAFDVETTEFSDTDVFFGANGATGSVAAISYTMLNTTLSNFSLSVSEIINDGYRSMGLCSQLTQSILANISFFNEIDLGHTLVGFYGIALEASVSNITNVIMLGNIIVDGAEEASLTLGVRRLDEFSAIKQFTTNCKTVVTGGVELEVSGLATYLCGIIADSVMLGSISASERSESQGNCSFSAVSFMMTGQLLSSYLDVHITLTTTSFSFSSLGPLRCKGCVLQGVSTLNCTVSLNTTSKLHFGTLSYLSSKSDGGLAPRFEFCVSSVELEADGAVEIAGFIHTAIDITESSIFVQLLLKRQNNAEVGLFYISISGEATMSESNIGIGSGDAAEVSIAQFSEGVDLSQYFVNCDGGFMDPGIPTCKTEAEMKSEEFIAELSSDFELEPDVNGGFPFSVNAFCLDVSGVFISNVSEVINVSNWFGDAGLQFPENMEHEFCRGQCFGTYESPVTYDCHADTNWYCLTPYVSPKFVEDLCDNDESKTCNRGQTLCRRNYEWHDDKCSKTCADTCLHGRCEDGRCLCDLYYVGSSCNEYECDFEKQQCYGIGMCTVVEQQDYCQCYDPEALFLNYDCIPDSCPGLLANQGVCARKGPLCFEHYKSDGVACNACEDGYEMKGTECMEVLQPSNDNVAIIIGSVCAGVFVLLFCVVIIYVMLRRRKPSTDESALLINQ